MCLTQKIDFGAHQEIADLRARPAAVDERIAIDHAADIRIRREDRTDVAIDACDRMERPENLKMVGYAHAERQRKIRDVRETLNVVVGSTVAAGGPFSTSKDLGRWHVPEAGVAVSRREGRSRLAIGWGRRRLSRRRWSLCVRCCG